MCGYRRSCRPVIRTGPRFGGFSLVEVVLVMVVIGTVSMIAVPRFVNYTCKRKVEAAARRIAADVTWAQRLARAKGSPFAVVFNTARQQYHILDVAGGVAVPHPDHSGKPYLIDCSKEFESVTLVSASLGGDERVEFDPWGAADGAGVILVRMSAWKQTVSVSLNGNISVGTLGVFEGDPVDPVPIEPIVPVLPGKGTLPEAS